MLKNLPDEAASTFSVFTSNTRIILKQSKEQSDGKFILNELKILASKFVGILNLGILKDFS